MRQVALARLCGIAWRAPLSGDSRALYEAAGGNGHARGVAALLFGELGTPDISGLVGRPAVLMISTASCVALRCTSNDSDGGTGQVLRATSGRAVPDW